MFSSRRHLSDKGYVKFLAVTDKQISRRQEFGLACVAHCTCTVLLIVGQVMVSPHEDCAGLGVRPVVSLHSVEQSLPGP